MDKNIKSKYIIILITSPKKKAKDIIEYLLKQKLIACGNIIEKINSLYWWEGKICKDEESLLILKTKKVLFNKVVKEVKKVHPYKVPEIISLNLSNGNKEYLNWINEVTQ